MRRRSLAPVSYQYQNCRVDGQRAAVGGDVDLPGCGAQHDALLLPVDAVLGSGERGVPLAVEHRVEIHAAGHGGIQRVVELDPRVRTGSGSATKRKEMEGSPPEQEAA